MNPFKKNCWSKIVCKTDNNNSIFRDEFQFEIWLERNFTEFWGWRNKKLFTFAIRFNCGGKFIHSEVFELNRNFLIENLLKFLVISMCFEWHYWTLNLRGLRFQTNRYPNNLISNYYADLIPNLTFTVFIPASTRNDFFSIKQIYECMKTHFIFIQFSFFSSLTIKKEYLFIFILRFSYFSSCSSFWSCTHAEIGKVIWLDFYIFFFNLPPWSYKCVY